MTQRLLTKVVIVIAASSMALAIWPDAPKSEICAPVPVIAANSVDRADFDSCRSGGLCSLFSPIGEIKGLMCNLVSKITPGTVGNDRQAFQRVEKRLIHKISASRNTKSRRSCKPPGFRGRVVQGFSNAARSLRGYMGQRASFDKHVL